MEFIVSGVFPAAGSDKNACGARACVQKRCVRSAVFQHAARAHRSWLPFVLCFVSEHVTDVHCDLQALGASYCMCGPCHHPTLSMVRAHT
eukprot:13178191-Alexandrium_andersonii.AAC.1